MSQVQVRLTPILLVLLLAAGGSGCSVLNFTTEMDVMATSTLDSVRVYQDAGLTSDGVNWGRTGHRFGPIGTGQCGAVPPGPL